MGADVAKALTKDQRQRQEVIHEIISAERAYARDLSIIIDVRFCNCHAPLPCLLSLKSEDVFVYHCNVCDRYLWRG